MDAVLYCQILETSLLPFIRNTLPCHRFQQDNDPKHTSRYGKNFFNENDVFWWETPPESPDLNPIELLWHELHFMWNCNLKLLEERLKGRWDRGKFAYLLHGFVDNMYGSRKEGQRADECRRSAPWRDCTTNSCISTTYCTYANSWNYRIIYWASLSLPHTTTEFTKCPGLSSTAVTAAHSSSPSFIGM